MALTYGFYDSVNHDRVYNARQFNSFLDGVINDGVFRTVGTRFTVTKVDGENWKVKVGSGKAFFNGIWTYNDSDIELEVDPRTSTSYSRYDSVILKIDENSRTNSIEIKKGTDVSSSTAQADVPKPELVNADGIHEYRLANIYIPYNHSSLSVSDIENDVVGSSETPFTMFSDLPFAASFTYGVYNAGDPASSGWYEMNPGIVPKCLIIFSVKTKTRPSSSGGGSYHYPTIESFQKTPSSSAYGECSLMIFSMQGSPAPGDINGSKWKYWFDKISGQTTDPRDIMQDRMSSNNGNITSCTLRFAKKYFAGQGLRAWIAIGDPISQS